MVHVIINNPEVCSGTFYLSLTPDQYNLLEFLQSKLLLDDAVEFQTVDFEVFETV